MTVDLHTASYDEIVAELKRRSVGVMIAAVRVDENGEVWTRDCKGSTAMLVSLHDALNTLLQSKAQERAKNGQGFYDANPPLGGAKGSS